MTYHGRRQGNALLWSGLGIVACALALYALSPFHLQKFAAFPGLAGVFLLCLWGAKQCEPGLRRVLQGVLWSGFALCIFGFVGLQGIIFANAKDDIQGDPSVMIVLGAQVKPTGPSVLLADRLHTAYNYWENHTHVMIVVTGGQGPDEPQTEASAMAEYLIACGVPRDQILLEEKASNTNENLRNSFALLAQEGYDVTQDMIVVSSDFHLARVELLWNRVTGGQDNLSRLAAPCSHRPSKIQSYVREAPALVKSWIFDR